MIEGVDHAHRLMEGSGGLTEEDDLETLDDRIAGMAVDNN